MLKVVVALSLVVAVILFFLIACVLVACFLWVSYHILGHVIL